MTQQEQVEVVPEVQDDTSAIEAMSAGYNKQRGIEPEIETEAEVVEAAVEVVPQAPPQPTLDDAVAELKQRIAALDETPASVRKIYGELGNIQRTIKELKSQPVSSAPSAELTEALTQAEAVAEEFPELAGPLVKVLKQLGARPVAASSPNTDVDVDAVVESRVKQLREADAIEELSDEHPDFMTVRETPEYKEWLDSKDAAYRDKFLHTWNPRVVSKGLTEFKAWRDKAQAAQAGRQERLTAAITPKGEGGSEQPSKLPDSAGLSAGYNKVRRLQRSA